MEDHVATEGEQGKKDKREKHSTEEGDHDREQGGDREQRRRKEEEGEGRRKRTGVEDFLLWIHEAGQPGGGQNFLPLFYQVSWETERNFSP